MDIGFVITYLLCPIIVSVGLITGKRTGDHHQLLTAYAFKGMFYFYSAAANLIHFINQSHTERDIIGLAIGLAIIEGTNGIMEAKTAALEWAKEQEKKIICENHRRSCIETAFCYIQKRRIEVMEHGPGAR